jgi:hypothetical protein
MNVHRTAGLKPVPLALVGLLVFAALTQATALTPFIDLQEKGLTVVVDAVGTEGIGSGTRNLTVNVGGTVRFALLYWAGRQRPCEESTPGSGNCVLPAAPALYRDQQVVFNGTALTGTMIGNEHQPVSGGGPIQNVGYLADVTSIVAAAGTGSHTFTFQDGNLASNLWRLNGAALVVGYIDAADPSTYRCLIQDGLDFAFGTDPTPGDNRVTALVTFNHGANLSPRTAELWTVSGDSEPTRPDRIDISNNPSLFNLLDGSSGVQFDLEAMTIDIPANVGSTTVQMFSLPLNQNPDSLLWEVAILRLQQIDTSQPTCPITSVTPGPPAQVQVTFQDTGTGIAELLVTKSENADTVIPPFDVGSTAPVVMTSTKIDQSKRARVEVRATDMAGNVALCDPILTEVVRDDTTASVQTFDDVPEAEHVLTLWNGDPTGLKSLDVVVNRQQFKIKNLQPGEQRTIDIGSAMHPGDNRVTLSGKGKRGASATVMLWDGATE